MDYNHPDLDQNIWTNPGETGSGKETNKVDDDQNGCVDDVRGCDFYNNDGLGYNNDGDPMDDNRHGTHVAGTIAAEANSEGVVGVNWKAQIMALKFLGASGTGSTSNAIRALDYAVANGSSLSNNSWGGASFSQALLDALKRVDAAAPAGHLFVAAAGNGGSDNVSDNNDTTPHYPSSYDSPNVVAVAATDRNDTLASFSNYGKTSVDLAAPGVSIWSTVLGTSYASLNGTSMATPHVTGAATLIKVKKPTLNDAGIKESLLGQNVDPISSLAGKMVTGGRLNLPKTLGFTVTGSPTGPEVPLKTNVTATFSEDIDQASLTKDTFTLKAPDGSLVGAALSYDAATKTATLDPTDDLQTGTEYTATVTTGVKRADTRESLVSDKVWSFTTTDDVTPPTVESVSPNAAATGVRLDTNVTAAFSEDIEQSTLTTGQGGTFALKGSNGSLVDAALSYDAATKKATLNPSANLAVNTSYTATIKGGTDGVKDKVGNPLADKVWSFTTTNDATPPSVIQNSPTGWENVPKTTNVTVKFSEDIDRATLTRDTFMLIRGGYEPTPATKITSGTTVRYDAATRTATLDPYGTSDTKLETCSRYTAKLTSGVTDTVGNPAVEKVWTFKTWGC